MDNIDNSGYEIGHYLGVLVRNHLLYVICSLAYFVLGGILLGGKPFSFVIAFVIYFVSLTIACSALAEKILRFLNGVRSIETNEEREQLMPIFNEVINAKSQKRYKEHFSKIELCIIDKLQVNAFAMGRRTIAITKGAMKAFDDEQLKGIIAHELAHIRVGDTFANTFLQIASGYFYLIISLFKLIVLIMDKISPKDKSIGKFFCSFGRTISKLIIAFISLLSQIVFAIESRKREYRADKIAYKFGFGSELISALYLLEKINLGDNRNFTQKLTASHPRTTARIGRLEGMGENNNTF